MDALPDTLVLGAGGTPGEAWMGGVLSGIGLDIRDCENVLGTSAGSIVAALRYLGGEVVRATGRAPRWRGRRARSAGSTGSRSTWTASARSSTAACAWPRSIAGAAGA